MVLNKTKLLYECILMFPSRTLGFVAALRILFSLSTSCCGGGGGGGLVFGWKKGNNIVGFLNRPQRGIILFFFNVSLW